MQRYPLMSRPLPPASAVSAASSSSAKGLTLDVLPGRFGICRLKPDETIPTWALRGSFTSISRSSDELSIVCEEDRIPARLRCERDWRALKVLGPLDFALVGVLDSIAGPLAEADVSLFAISTFDTDYILVRQKTLARALQVLRATGHHIPTGAPIADAEPEAERPARRPRRETPRAAVWIPDEDDDEDNVELPSRERDEPIRTEPSRSGLSRSEPSQAEDRSRRRRRRRKPEEEKTAREIALPEFDALEIKDDLDIKDADEAPRPRRRRRAAREEAPEVEAAPRRRSSAERPERRPRTERPARAERAEPAAPAEAEAPPKARRRIRHDEVDGHDLYSGAIPQDDVETLDSATFADLGISPPILATIREIGFRNPTPIQASVLPHAFAGRDVIGLAQTGSGKTAAFSLPLAEKLTHGHGVRGLILCPTREIALQTEAFLNIFGRDHDLDTAVIIGGVRMGPQIDALKKQPDIIVATPGRIADHLRRRNVRFDKIEELVLDEADHMLDLGFLPQIQEILEHMPAKRQTMMFSATMPPPIERLTRRFMNDPVLIDLRPEGRIAEGIEHRLYLVAEEDKHACLLELIKEVSGTTLVFTRRKIRTEWLTRLLEEGGFGTERIHSDRSQGQRVEALRGFRQGDHQVLVATDVAARGIDIPSIQHVVNFGAPETVEDYVHRAGRTARGSAQGIVSTIATWQDKEMLSRIESAVGKKIPRCEVPGVEPWVELKPRRKTVRRRRLL